MNAFSARLRELRGTMPVEELARLSGVAAASIYKMESTAKVRWATVDAAYERFLAEPAQRLDTLILWAVEQSGDPKIMDEWNKRRGITCARS